MGNSFRPLLLTPLLITFAGCCCTSGDVSINDSSASLDAETMLPPTKEEIVPQGPSPNDDPQASLDWFVQRYREELPKIESSPYQDETNNREERAVYQSLSHEADLVASDSADQPHRATVLMKIRSIGRYEGGEREAFTTDYRFQLVAQEGRWEIDKVDMKDPNFGDWNELWEISLTWERPLFDAAKIVYGLEVDSF